MKTDLLPVTESRLVGALATLNEDGSPWNTPLHFVFGDDEVIWLSSEQSQHSQNISRDPRVSITLWSGESMANVKGAYIQSRARKVTGIEEVAARTRYAARFGGEVPEKFMAAETYIAPIGEINTTKTRGGRLYFDGDSTPDVAYN